MPDNQDKINLLLNKLETLLRRQETFNKEVNILQEEIKQLKTSENESVPTTEIKQEHTPIIKNADPKKELATSSIQTPKPPVAKISPKKSALKIKKVRKSKFSIEKFVGGNLISIIGIAITVLGVSFGAKYVIDHQLISPLTRIILGYFAGLGLLAIAFKLKTKYKNYSAVLLSGSMAIMYFITFLAYSLYGLIPQVFAFALMAVFTVFTVVSAISYNRQIIAHVGLVGAYAIPFLLSNNSGQVVVLFGYMAIINIGILVIAIKKYWKPLYYSSFGLTWIIYSLWFATSYQAITHFRIALTFLLVFFTIFYITFLIYKLLKNEKFDVGDIILLLVNSFIFFGLGIATLKHHRIGDEFLGLFTLCNAILHFVVGTIIYKQKLADKNLFYLVVGLVLVFITITFPIQLDGSWVTLLWVAEATLLFWIGRTKKISIYEQLSYILMLLAFFSIIHDWLLISFNYNEYSFLTDDIRLTPFLNINFLTSIIFATAFGFIYLLNRNKKYITQESVQKTLYKIGTISISTIFLIVLYYTFRNEISIYWQQLYVGSSTKIKYADYNYFDYFHDSDLKHFKSVWIINYSLLFLSILSFVNIKKIKNQLAGIINLSLNTIVIVVFLLQGLLALSELRESYLGQNLAEYFHRGVFNIFVRYISYAFVVIMLVLCYKYARQEFIKIKLNLWVNIMLHISVLWIASSEIINLMDIADSEQSYKLGLSILWGMYSLLLIVLGIWKRKLYLRIGAFSLFGITLIKLFFYDISHLNTISKTIVFVSLGILLLIISFLYNKYKHIIFDDHENKS